jgi:hypothetical protein
MAAASAAEEEEELRALRTAVAALPTEAQAHLLIDLLPSLPAAARAAAAAGAAAAAEVHAAVAPRRAALAGAAQELARMAPKPLRAHERDDVIIEEYRFRAEALMARCAELATDAHAVGVLAGVAERECEDALLVVVCALRASYWYDGDNGCEVAGQSFGDVPSALAWVYRELLCAQAARGRGAPDALRAAVRRAVAARGGDAGARLAPPTRTRRACRLSSRSGTCTRCAPPPPRSGWRCAWRRHRSARTKHSRPTQHPRASSALRRAKPCCARRAAAAPRRG